MNAQKEPKALCFNLRSAFKLALVHVFTMFVHWSISISARNIDRSTPYCQGANKGGYSYNLGEYGWLVRDITMSLKT